MPFITLYFITAGIYAVLGLIDLRRVRGSPAGVSVLGANQSVNLVHLGTLVGLVFHGVLLHFSLFPEDRLDLSLGNSLSLIAGVTVAVYWLGSFSLRMGILRCVILFIAAAACLSPLLLPATKAVSYGGLLAFRLHLVISLLAYSLFTLAALHAGLIIALEKRLRGGLLAEGLGDLPPLVVMDTLLFRMIFAGFILLTLTLASGVLFSEELFHRPMKFNHKNIFAFLSWGIFLALLLGRRYYGWRGRRAAHWALYGFASLVIGYFGSKIVLEMILHRT